jgi:hypothetical protein
MRLLGCGCGPETITIDLAELVLPGHVFGIDLEPAQLRAAQHRARQQQTNASFGVASIYTLPFFDGSSAPLPRTNLLWYRSEIMSRKNRARPAKIPKSKKLTLRQSKFAEAYMKTRSLKKAALAAGYSPKHPSQSGDQALKDIQHKAPEVMRELGLGMSDVIEKHLIPLLNANETKFFQKDGKITDFVEVEALPIRLGATRLALELLVPKDPAALAPLGVEVVLVDVPRPDRSAIEVKPTNVTKPPAKPALPSDNGHKPDPRPKD